MLLFGKNSASPVKLSVLLLILLIATACFGNEVPSFFPGTLTVKLTEDFELLCRQEGSVRFGAESLDALAEQFGASALEKRFRYNERMATRAGADGLARIYRLTLDESADILAAARAFSADPHVEYAEPIYIMYEYDTPNDTYYADAHQLTQIYASQAWDVHHGEDGTEVVIGMCDSGIDWTHNDLVDNLFQNLGEDADHDGHVIEFINGEWVFDPGDVNNVDDDDNGYADDFVGWNFHNDDGSPINDPNGSMTNVHGTLSTGMAAARTNNNLGVASVSWNVKFYPTKHGMNYITWPPGIIYDAFDGIIYLAEMGCDIINCSWGGDGYSYANQEALAYARNLGAIIVAAAGNASSESPLFYPASYPEVISVAAVIPGDLATIYTNYGIGIDVCAPGGTYSGARIQSTSFGNEYGFCSGTSFASPIVSGLLALLKSYHPDWTNDQLITQVLGTCDDIDSNNPDYENKLGCGRINAYRALTETNVTIPQELRLELVGWLPIDDSDGDNMLEPGDAASIGLVLRNYAHYVSSDNVTLTLSVNNSDVTVTNASSTVSIPADCDDIVFEDLFTIQVAASAEPQTIDLTVQVAADIDITYGQSFTLQQYISPSGVLIWDGGVNDQNNMHFSGDFIYQYLQANNIDCAIATEFPSSLVGFDAVFLSFGNYGEAGSFDYPFLSREARTVTEYLEAGGKLYLEGGSALGFYNGDNAELLDLLGLSVIDSGDYEDYFDALVGQDGTLGEDLVFDRSTQFPRFFLDRFAASGSGQVVFTARDYGDVAVQNTGSNGQKTFCSSYSLAGLHGDANFNRREMLLARILQFFGFPVMEPGFKLVYPDDFAPHAPIELTVLDKTVTSSAITSWAWDFDNDGTTDATVQNPNYTFDTPGWQTTTLTVSDGANTCSLTAENYLHLFNGDSALEFSNTTAHAGVATIAAEDAPELDGAFTLEVWIKPNEYGTETIVDNPPGCLIVDKGAVKMWPNENYQGMQEHCLAIMSEHANGACVTLTPSNSILLGEWTHVAVTYDGQSAFTVYLNGQAQELTQSATPSGALVDNSGSDFVIGNTCEPDSMMIVPSYSGAIDELRVWNDVRTASEVQQNMSHALTGSEDDLAGYWNMNEAIGDEILDRTSNAAIGVLHYVAWTDGAIDPPVAVDEHDIAPQVTRLRQNVPNPFNPQTTIRFSLRENASAVALDVYNVRGQKVRTLVRGALESGEHSVVWRGDDDNGAPVSSGVYFYRLQAGDKVEAKKMLLLK